MFSSMVVGGGARVGVGTLGPRMIEEGVLFLW